ncbi:MAG: hypothetical protein CW346_17750 [Bacillaceae bacterium]|nr:hypothetical protein [Bacillaceae bacterium]
MPRLPLLLTEEQHKRLRRLYAETRIPMTEHVRRALMEYLEREEGRLGLPPADEKEGNADDH